MSIEILLLISQFISAHILIGIDNKGELKWKRLAG
jgi:hypothetical protein